MSRRSAIHDFEARERRGRWFPAFAGLLVIAVLTSTWIGLFSFMSANAAYGTVADVEDEFIPDIDEMDLTLPDLSRVSQVYASGGEVLAELHDGRNSQPIPYERMPRVMVHAILAAEDKEFFVHEGVDFRAIMSAAIDNIVLDTTRGGSTITQQVVKQNFVGAEVSIRRKIAEAFVSAELERRYEKETILEYYLNSVYFGYGSYGVAAASREYFRKPLSKITINEAATLSVLVRNPTLYDPRRRPESVIERRDGVIDEMAEAGWISDEDAEIAKAEELPVLPHRIRRGRAEHVVAEIKRQLLDLDRHEFDFLGTTKEERKRAIFGCPADDTACTGGGGLKIESTIDLEAQDKANEILQQWLPYPDAETNLALCTNLAGELALDTDEKIQSYTAANSCAPTGAIATVEAATGAVRVMASGLPFEVDQFDLAVQGKRNPGSSFKPFTLMAGLEYGDIEGREVTLGSYYDSSSPIVIECPYVCSSRGNEWEVSNAGGGGSGVMSVEDATANSVNTVYAQMAIDIGPEQIVQMAHRMGIESELRPVPSITLGTSEVTPLEMASAYTNFSTNGAHAAPYLVSKITNSRGDVLYEHTVEVTQVTDPLMFAAARRPLLRVPISTTAPKANIGRPQGGKTGTHQDYRDAWFVGFVPQYATAVWVGYEADQIPLTSVTINGEFYSRVFGGSVPGPIWRDFMSWYLEDVPPADFVTPEGNIGQYFKTPTTSVPSVVGLDVNAARSELRRAKLGANVVEVPSLEPEGLVLAQAPGAGATVPQGTGVTIEVSTGIPPTGILPEVFTLTFEDALAALQAFSDENRLDLVFERASQPVEDPALVGLVVGLRPGVGTEVGYGATVAIVVGAPPPEDG
ncbi:MAG: transglycosylase domain-containing protein [Acidimicrobiia bacterium]|nr:transglycosylase domain-containing protein [Acidimicrobiia bacterium]